MAVIASGDLGQKAFAKNEPNATAKERLEKEGKGYRRGMRNQVRQRMMELSEQLNLTEDQKRLFVLLL